MAIDRQTIEALQEAGISMQVVIRTAYGGTEASLTADQVLLHLRDPDAAAADWYGVPKAAYLQWLEAEGAPACSALLKNGRRCGNLCGHRQDDNPSKWLRDDGGYCPRHGGPSRDEWRTD